MPTTSHAAQVLNGMLNDQSQIVAYNNDWKLMMLTSLPMLLLLLLMHGPKKGSGGGATHAPVMD
jgi:DHA2 family multidrug resistance protein